MSAERARALWVVGPGRAELREEPLPAPGPGEVAVRALFSGISRGTEGLVLGGRVPPSQHRLMRAPFQAGDFPWPVKYGYVSVGLVEALGDPVGEAPADQAGDRGGVVGPTVGARVFCLHPHQDRYVVPASAVVPLPDDVPAARAVLTANLETAINAVWDAAPGPGDRVTVIGAGVVGSLVAWLVGQIPGTDVELVDLLPERAEVARALGVGFAHPDQAAPDRDLVVHASASASGLSTALGLAGVEATVLELSWFGDRAVPVPLGEAFHSRRLTLRSSQVGRLPPGRAPRWDYRRRLGVALRLLADPALDVLLDGESPFEALPDVLPRITGPGGGLCHRIRYPEPS